MPIGDKIELNLGPDPEVIFELVKLRTWRDDFWMQVNGTNIFRRVDQPGMQIEVNSSVAGWDDHTLFAQRVRNYTKKPIDLEVRRTLRRPRGLPQRVGGQEPRLPDRGVHGHSQAGRKGRSAVRNRAAAGHNAKQNNVTIEQPRSSRKAIIHGAETGSIFFFVFLGFSCLNFFRRTLIGTRPRGERRSLTVPDRQCGATDDLQLRRPYPGGESRKVTFKPGVNPLQFSWANTLIDPTSVELRFLTHPESSTVLDTTFPHAKPQMLYWNVQSEMDGEALVEISYFTSGIHWSPDYLGIAAAGRSPDEHRRLRAGR